MVSSCHSPSQPVHSLVHLPVSRQLVLLASFPRTFRFPHMNSTLLMGVGLKKAFRQSLLLLVVARPTPVGVDEYFQQANSRRREFNVEPLDRVAAGPDQEASLSPSYWDG